MADAGAAGIGGLLVVFAILNSSLANANAGATAATRSLFAMGRARLLPRWFARRPAHVQVAGQRGPLPGGDRARHRGRPGLRPGQRSVRRRGQRLGGLNVYVFLGTMLGLIFAFMYIAVNLACIGYFLRERRDEFNVLKHLVVPVLGVIAMIPAVLAVIGGVTIPILDVELPPYENALEVHGTGGCDLARDRGRRVLRAALAESRGPGPGRRHLRRRLGRDGGGPHVNLSRRRRRPKAPRSSRPGQPPGPAVAPHGCRPKILRQISRRSILMLVAGISSTPPARPARPRPAPPGPARPCPALARPCPARQYSRDSHQKQQSRFAAAAATRRSTAGSGR